MCVCVCVLVCVCVRVCTFQHIETVDSALGYAMIFSEYSCFLHHIWLAYTSRNLTYRMYIWHLK